MRERRKRLAASHGGLTVSGQNTNSLIRKCFQKEPTSHQHSSEALARVRRISTTGPAECSVGHTTRAIPSATDM
jgi:hypothetical protein